MGCPRSEHNKQKQSPPSFNARPSGAWRQLDDLLHQPQRSRSIVRGHDDELQLVARISRPIVVAIHLMDPFRARAHLDWHNNVRLRTAQTPPRRLIGVEMRANNQRRTGRSAAISMQANALARPNSSIGAASRVISARLERCKCLSSKSQRAFLFLSGADHQRKPWPRGATFGH